MIRAPWTYAAVTMVLGACAGGLGERRARELAAERHAREQVERARRAPEGVVGPFWLLGPPDPLGHREAWWVDAGGRIFSFLLSQDVRPKPARDQEPVGRLQRDGSAWALDGSRRWWSIRGADGEFLRDGVAYDGYMRCWVTEPCQLRCECSGHTPLVSFSWDPREPPAAGWTVAIEPTPASPAQCRYALAMAANLALSKDDHGDNY